MAAILVILLLIACFLYTIISMNPRLDWNYKTGEKLLWYNDPFHYGSRRSIVLYKNITKIKN